MKTSVLSFDYFLTSTDGDCMAVDDVLVLCLTSGLSFHLLLGYLPLFFHINLTSQLKWKSKATLISNLGSVKCPSIVVSIIDLAKTYFVY